MTITDHDVFDFCFYNFNNKKNKFIILFTNCD